MTDKVWMKIKPTSQIAPSCNDDNSRYALKSVMVVPGKLPKKPKALPGGESVYDTAGWLVATNGRMLACAATEIELAAPPAPEHVLRLVPKEAFPANASEVRLNGRVETIRGKGAKAKTEVHDMEEADVSFPPVGAVVDDKSTFGGKKDGLRWFGINAELLTCLAASVGDDGRVLLGIREGPDGHKKPIVVMHPEQSSFGVIMPVSLPEKVDLDAAFRKCRDRFVRDLTRAEAIKRGATPPAEPEEPEPADEAEEAAPEIDMADPDPAPTDTAPHPTGSGGGKPPARRRGKVAPPPDPNLEPDRQLVQAVAANMASLSGTDMALVAFALGRTKPGSPTGMALDDADRQRLRAMLPELAAV